MQQPLVGVTGTWLTTTLASTMVAPKSAPYLDFALRLIAIMEREGVRSKTIVDELGIDAETERLWRKGKRMPGRDNMRELAKFFGISLAELRDGDVQRHPAAPGAFVVTEDDERSLIDMYRKLEPWAKDALRARAAQLLQDFGPKGKDNPYGKKTAGTQ